MRQTISGLLAAFAVLFAGAAPAMACEYSGCTPVYSYAPAYYSYAPTSTYTPSGCTACDIGWGYQRLAEPQTQYYYVNQGPTYTGPGAFAPYPVYHETAVTGWAGYERAPGYYGGYPASDGYHVWHHGYVAHRYAYHHHIRRAY
jgi:hypothetical protein